MMRWGLFVCVGLMALSCFAQETNNTPKSEAEKKFYKLDFVVQEVEGSNVVNSRDYSLTVRGDTSKNSIRAGEKVPYVTGPAGSTSSQWMQIDVGVNIDCEKLEAMNDAISMRVFAQVSSVAAGQPQSASVPPIIRNNQWESYVTLPMRRPTVLFSSDDPASKRTMRLQLTVTPIPW